MILHQENEMIIGNSGEKRSFTIGTSSKAFQILSSGIYKHKIRAIAREVMCNAFDAHLMNGTAKQWEVTVPSELDPRFIVKDYGPGLSEEMMFEIYTQYFASTKTGCEIGGFGLGAKSPFSYTDTFSVESCHCGVVKSYTAMIVNGEPQMVKTYEGLMSDLDHSGLTVTVPVSPADLTTWHTEIHRMLMPFKSGSYKLFGPSINTQNAFDKIEGYNNDWFKIPVGQTDHSGINAVYGNIVYPLTDVPGMQTQWLTNGRPVFIHFEMNSLMPQPSREELQLDEFTVKNIVSRVNAINELEKQKAINRLARIENIRELKRTIPQLSYVRRNILDAEGYTFLGKKCEDLMGDFDLRGIAALLKQARIYTLDEINPLKRVISEKSSYNRVSILPVYRLLGIGSKQVVVILDDVEKPRVARELCKYIDSNRKDLKVDDSVAHSIILGTWNSSILQHIEKLMEGDEVLVFKVSEYETKIKKQKARKPSQKRVSRPTAPNAYRLEYNEKTKCISKQELFLTAQEAAEIEGPVIGLYGQGGITAMMSDFTNVSGIAKSDVNRFLLVSGRVSSITQVRPAIYKHVMKSQKAVCAISIIQERLVKILNNIAPQDFYVLRDNGERFFENVKHVQNAYPTFFGTEYDKDRMIALKLIDEYSNMEVYYPKDEKDNFSRMMKLFKEGMDKKRQEFKVAKDQFRKTNPIEWFYLDRAYSVQKDELAALEKFFN